MFDIAAPAKVNLFLHVTGRREDGYHLLQSLMVFADVCDVLSFAEAPDFQLKTGGPFAAGLGTGNIVEKAARALAAASGIPLRGHVTLRKNLPVAAGLGGGSSDAAAALRGLSKLWGLPDDPGTLGRIAPALGADVPACLARRPVWAESIGEKITPVDMLPLHLVLANPGVPLATAEVFKNFRRSFSPVVDAGADFRSCRNDLTEAATGLCPLIPIVLQELEQMEGCSLARMSGSGATCFGVYPDAAQARGAAEQLRRWYPGWWVAAAQTSS